MCGIAGIYNQDTVDKDLLKRMCDVIRHRGPDDEGYYFGNNIGIGMRRLSIIDLNTGRQPIHNEDKTVWIVFNGEIYNFMELREELEKKEHRFYTRTDTETIIHLYEELEEGCVDRLNGMFCFAIWDENKRKLLIARDRIGEKQVYYYCREGGLLLFGSEIKSLLQYEEISKEIDVNALDAYFTYLYVPSPQTIFKHIRKLPPGHILTMHRNTIKIKKYWDLEYNIKEDRPHNFIEGFKERFKKAVRIRLISDVPLGAFLSGGIDSSAITAVMSEYMDRPVETFSIGYNDKGYYYDERKYAKIVAERFGTNHHEFVVQPDILKIIPEIVKHFDEPFADSSAIPNYYISQMTRKHVTVAMSGLGGDEIGAGYERYIGILLWKYYKLIPRYVRESLIARLINTLPDSKKGKRFVDRAKRFVNTGTLSVDETYLSYISSLKYQQRQKLYSRDLLKQVDLRHAEEIFHGYFSRNAHLDLINKILFVDLKMYLPDDLLTLTDRMSMAHSLEVRAPFLDHTLVEYMASIPPELKLKGFTKKYILKKAFEGILPDEILYRKKKGFTLPLTLWLRGEARPLIRDILNEDNINKIGFFKWETVQQLMERHFSGRENYHGQLWALIIFLIWHDLYIGK